MPLFPHWTSPKKKMGEARVVPEDAGLSHRAALLLPTGHPQLLPLKASPGSALIPVCLLVCKMGIITGSDSEL